jgi:hypothetical protein
VFRNPPAASGSASMRLLRELRDLGDRPISQADPHRLAA